MGADEPPRRLQVGAGRLTEPRTVGVVPDVPAIDKVFDYTIPETLAGDVRAGTLVRVDLHGRRIGGWVDVARPETPGAGPGVALKPITKVTGWGPPAELVELSRWAAWRWAGPRSSFLGSASPVAAVRGLPRAPAPAPPATVVIDPAVAAVVGDALRSPSGGAVVRLPPSTDLAGVVSLVVATIGPSVVVAASHADAQSVASRLRRQGLPVSLLPREWAAARAGGSTVVGARGAVWAPLERPAAIVVLDGHDEGHQQEQSPTWHATDVAIERARRLGVPCVVVTPCPDAQLLAWRPATTLARRDERDGWPVVDVLDRRGDDPRTGLYGERLASILRRADRAVCVLNRKGRARLLSCAACGELARCEHCGASVAQSDDAEAGGLVCRRCAAWRPSLCAACGSTRLKSLRVGVTRAREELEALLHVPVGEVTGDTDDVPDTPVVIGTEAVLHRVARADVVAFLDLDQELLAPRYRAAEQALSLLARAARLVGGRAGGGRLALQTRLPQHEVVQAALLGDPSRVTDAEAPKRALLGFPPAAALAAISGAAAEEYVDRLVALGHLGVDVIGPSDGRWLVRAPDHQTLCDALAAVDRPPGRVRVAVDP
ncbi:MAG TPA: hypothetical protein VF230_05340, partial [Acidimicrobiales bacterium]